MKLSDFLTTIGRPIAFYPSLRKITGSTNATIFLCQFVYWTGKENSKDGWIYKTSNEIEEETGLSYDEQKTARAKLKQARLIKERYARLEHQMYFKVVLDVLNEKWGNRQNGFPEHGITALAKAESQHSLNESETTSETTPDAPIEKELPKVKLPLGSDIGWMLAGGVGTEEIEKHLQKEKLEHDATIEFERALGFNSLNWNSPKYKRLLRCVIETYKSNAAAFARWADERRREGQFSKKPSSDKIRADPEAFADTWPTHFPKRQEPEGGVLYA